LKSLPNRDGFVARNEQANAANWIESTKPYGTWEGAKTSMNWYTNYVNPYSNENMPKIPATSDDMKTRRALQYVTDNQPVPDEYRGMLRQGQTNLDPYHQEYSEKPVTYYTPTSKTIINNVQHQAVDSPLGINYNSKQAVLDAQRYWIPRADSLANASLAHPDDYATARKLYEAVALAKVPEKGAWKKIVRFSGTPYLDATAWILPDNQVKNSTKVPNSYVVDRWGTAAGYVTPFEPNPALSVVPLNTKGGYPALVNSETHQHGIAVADSVARGQIPEVSNPYHNFWRKVGSAISPDQTNIGAKPYQYYKQESSKWKK